MPFKPWMKESLAKVLFQYPSHLSLHLVHQMEFGIAVNIIPVQDF